MEYCVLDTNILIHYLKREEPIFTELNQWISTDPTLMISVMTEAEVLAWTNLDIEHIELIHDLLKTLLIVPVYSPIARTAALFRRQYGTQLIDALIASTAYHRSAPLLTRNTKDFAKIREIEVLKI